MSTNNQSVSVEATETAINRIASADEVRRETLDGTEYAVAPVNILKPMSLNVPSNWDVDEAYLPEDQIRNSAPAWNGTPITLNHPAAANGAGTTANSPQMHEAAVLGRVFNATVDNAVLNAEAWLNIEKARDMGGAAENALDRVLNGETVEVSSGYHAEQLPSGRYDGQTRNAVQGGIRPDHVAILPGKQGKCSTADGCGVGAGVAANCDCDDMVVTNMDMQETETTQNQQDVPYEVTNVSPGDVSFTDEPWDGSEVEASLPNPSEDEDAADVLDVTMAAVPASEDTRDNKSNWKMPFRGGADAPANTRALVAIKAALEGARGGVEGLSDNVRENLMEWVNGMLDAADDDLFGADGEMSENSAWQFILNHGDSRAGSEVQSDDDLGGNSGDETQEESDNDNDNMTENDGSVADTDNEESKVVFNSEEEFEERVEEIVENRRKAEKKQDLARDIAMQSSEYDDADEVLEKYPTEAALNTKKKQVLGGDADYGQTRGASADVSTAENSDADDLTMFPGDV